MKFFREEEVRNVSLVTDLNLVCKMQVKLGKYSHGPRDWFLVNWPSSLCQKNLSKLTSSSESYVVTPIPDGIRYLLYINSAGQICMENISQHFFKLNPGWADKFLSSDKHVLTDTVLDGYLVRNLKQDGHLTFVIHDAIRCDGVDLTSLDIMDRINHINVSH